MNTLLDTHMAIWALLDSPKFTLKARQLIMDPDNTIYYSVVSVWEVLLKHSRHPDNMDFSADVFSKSCKDAGFVPLEPRDKHVITAGSFPPEVGGHKDPFDCLLLAQAIAENMSFLTHDSRLSNYQEKCLILQ
ncbi:MAG: type II toxin-antitoxin system VapC family toxin [Clostridia bacterium]|nr:type II toxin-antitoxin system VapC family toxin [Clostridia bacterium]